MKVKKSMVRNTVLVILIIMISIVLIKSIGVTKMEDKNKVVLHTNQGDIIIQLFDDTKITTDNFKKLVSEGYYDGTKFHRIISNFMIQGGDPLTKDDSQMDMWGTGDPGYKIKDDFRPNNKNDKGTISMANAGPNTGGSQFFINLVNNNFLDDKHPTFGEVIEGMDIVSKLGKVRTGQMDRPVDNVIIEKAELI